MQYIFCVVTMSLLQTEFVDELKTLDGYKQMADKSAGDLAPYLLNLYRSVIDNCLLKHSKRYESKQVSIYMLNILSYIYLCLYVGYASMGKYQLLKY